MGDRSGQRLSNGIDHCRASPGFGTKCARPPDPPDPPDPPSSGSARPTGSTHPRSLPRPARRLRPVRDHQRFDYDAVFGYQNDNEDPVQIAVGSPQSLPPAPQARGQTTDFLPGSHRRPSPSAVPGRQRSRLGRHPCRRDPHGHGCLRLPGEVRRAGAAGAPHRHLRLRHRPRRHVRRRLRLRERQPGRHLGPDRRSPTSCCRAREPRPADAVQPRPARGRVPRARSAERPHLVWSLSFRGTRFAPSSSTYPTRCAGGEPPRRVELAPLCVRRDGATYTAVFSYANLTREDVIVPLGSGNRVAPAPVDRGQPTVFRPGIVPFAFAVRDIPVGRASPGPSPLRVRSTRRAPRPTWAATAVSSRSRATRMSTSPRLPTALGRRR